MAEELEVQGLPVPLDHLQPSLFGAPHRVRNGTQPFDQFLLLSPVQEIDVVCQSVNDPGEGGLSAGEAGVVDIP